LNEQVSVIEDLNPYHPTGIKWDNVWWSCAYDSLFVILHNIWKESNRADYEAFSTQNNFWNQLTLGLQNMESNGITLEIGQDQIRLELQALSEILFPVGHVGAPVFSLCYNLLKINPGVWLPIALTCRIRHST
jgi:hypothetical protein